MSSEDEPLCDWRKVTCRLSDNGSPVTAVTSLGSLNSGLRESQGCGLASGIATTLKVAPRLSWTAPWFHRSPLSREPSGKREPPVPTEAPSYTTGGHSDVRFQRLGNSPAGGGSTASCGFRVPPASSCLTQPRESESARYSVPAKEKSHRAGNQLQPDSASISAFFLSSRVPARMESSYSVYKGTASNRKVTGSPVGVITAAATRKPTTA